MIRCPKCGYSNLPTATICVKCRTVLNQEPVPAGHDTIIIKDTVKETPQSATSKDSRFKTVRRRDLSPKASCFLVALSPDEEKELRKINLDGEKINLNRELLDEGNTSISRSGHAQIISKDGSWYIENSTSLKTTFLQVNEPLALKENDVLLIGDSLFKFKTK